VVLLQLYFGLLLDFQKESSHPFIVLALSFIALTCLTLAVSFNG
jgi:hypothetical protein